MAPELFSEGTVEVGTPADIWSLGATLVEIITGMPPFQNLGPLGAVFQLVDGNLSPIPIGVSDPLQAFLERCFDRNPKTRATAKELLQHSWITGKSTDKTAINVFISFSSFNVPPGYSFSSFLEFWQFHKFDCCAERLPTQRQKQIHWFQPKESIN